MISVDSLAKNVAFAEKEHLDFPILADPEKTTAGRYGVLSNFFGMEVARRWTFYIGPDGVIVDIDKKVNPVRSGADIVLHLRALNVPAAKPNC
jgi:peroxiredoxin Q/BCP